MRKPLALVIAAALLPGALLAQLPTPAQFEYVRFRNADGSISEARNVPMKVTIRPVKALDRSGKAPFTNPVSDPFAGKDRLFDSSSGKLGGGRYMGSTVVYQNDQGSNFFTDSPSCLDDLSLTAAGNGKPWKIVHFGIHLDTDLRTGKFLVRWRGWDTFVSGRGAGINAFDNEMFDAGFYLQRSQFTAGWYDFEVQIDLSLSPIFVVNNQTCYLAAQYREPHVVGFPPEEDGEGDFTSTWCSFTDNGPQVGTSDGELFWYDAEPNGIYDELEADNFGAPGPGASNFKFYIQVDSAGSLEEVNPLTFQWFRGTQVGSGGVNRLWTSDNSYLVGRMGLVINPAEPPLQLIVESFAPSSSVTSMRMDVESKANTVGLAQTIEFWNFALDRWDVVDTSGLTLGDQTNVGFAANPQDYVDPVIETIRAKISVKRVGLVSVFPWQVSFDKVKWYIGV